MTAALLIIDVQQALCSGKRAVFEAAGDLTQIVACSLQSVGTRVLVVPSDQVQFVT